MADGVTVTDVSGNFSIAANDINLNTSGKIDAGTGTLLINRASASGTIGLGSTTCGGSCDMTLDGTEISNITGQLALGGAGITTIYVNSLTAAQTATLNGAIQIGVFGAGTVIFEGSTSVFSAGTGLFLAASSANTLNAGITVSSGDITVQSGTVTAADGVSLTAGGGSVTLGTATNASGAFTVNATGDITINDNFISLGRLTITADSDASGAGDLTLASGVTITTNNNALDIQAANIDNSSSTIDAGSGAATFAITQSVTADGTDFPSITAGSLSIGVAGDLIVNGVTASELTNIAGLLTLGATGDVTFQTAASSHNQAVTVNAGNDINVKVDVTSGGDFTATADSDDSGVGDFTVDSGATVTSSAGDISVTAVNIVEDGTLASISGSVTRIESNPATVLADELDEGTQSTFVQDFTSPTEAGC